MLSLHSSLGKAELPTQASVLPARGVGVDLRAHVHMELWAAFRGGDVADHQLPWVLGREKWLWQAEVCYQINGKHEKVSCTPLPMLTYELFQWCCLVPAVLLNAESPRCSQSLTLEPTAPFLLMPKGLPRLPICHCCGAPAAAEFRCMQKVK